MSQQSITVTGDSAPTVEVTVDGQIIVTISASSAGSGDVTSSSTSLDNQIVRFDGTSGKIIQNSGITIADGASGTLSGTNTGDQNLFGTIAVAGQSNVVADSTNDTLTLVAGTNISITTNASTDTITINNTAASGGDVVGPASATDNALVRFDGTTGKLVQNGVVTESDIGDLAAINSLAFDTTPTGSLTTQGQAMWNVDEETVDIQLNGFALHVGEHVVYHVKNSTGSPIAKGVPVMFAGTTGNSGKLLIQPWNGTGPSTYFMGLTAESLANGDEGFVIAFGKLRGIQTNGGNYGESWADGQIVYASTTTGYLTKTQPAAPNPHIQVCAVVHAHNSNGTLFIRPTLGSNIKDDEGVTISSLASGQILVANSGGTVFFNKSVSGDATLADTGALTLATVNSNVGSFGNATVTPTVTVNGKGLVTAVSTHTITPAVGSITGLGTNVATSLGNNMGASGTLAILGANTFTAAQTVNAGSTTTAGLSLNQTWNSGATVCRGATITITDTASASGSTAFRIMGGASGTTELFNIDKSGWLNGTAGATMVIAPSSGNNLALYPTGGGNVQLYTSVQLADNGNFNGTTTNGMKIMTATNQKLAFWNATPIVQPTTSVGSATVVGGGGTNVTTTDTFDGYTIAQVVKALRNTGLLA